MFRKLVDYIDFVSKLLIAISIVLIVLLSFYWDFGVQSFQIKSIYTLDTGLVSVSVAPEFCLALIVIFLFYVGYRLYSARKPPRKLKIKSVETHKEMIVKYLLSIALGSVGAWLTYNEFSEARIWSYYLPHYTKISKGSFAMEVNAVIALLLLLIWFLVIEVRVWVMHKKEPNKSL